MVQIEIAGLPDVGNRRRTPSAAGPAPAHLTKDDPAAAPSATAPPRPRSLPQFKAWLERHGPFGAVVDGANVALYGQNFEKGGFNFGQIRWGQGAWRRSAAACRGSSGPGWPAASQLLSSCIVWAAQHAQAPPAQAF